MRLPQEPDDQLQEIKLAEVIRIPKSSTSTPQNTVDGVLKWTDENVIRLNPTKCKQEKMRGQRGRLRALAGICHVHESYF